jgi:hypothetical protein
MGEFDWLDKMINEESERVDDFFFSEDPLEEIDEDVKKKKVGRPKDTEKQKAKKYLKNAKDHVEEAMSRLEKYRARA